MQILHSLKDGDVTMGRFERLTTDAKGYFHINEQFHCVIMGAFEIVSQGSSIYRVRSGIVLATNHGKMSRLIRRLPGRENTAVQDAPNQKYENDEI